MTLKQLEYFLAIADAGHITTAAKNLNVSQPPLSLQLKALEAELGVALFERDKRNLTITREGKLLQERSRDILRLMNDTIYGLQDFGSEDQGILRIGTILSANRVILPQKILRFSHDHPMVKYSIMEGDSTYLMEKLEDGELDMAIIREPFNTSLYHTLPLVENNDDEEDFFAAFGKPEYFEMIREKDITFSSLKGLPLIINRRYYDLIINTCRQKGFAPNIVCDNTDITASVSWAIAGIGVAVASQNALKDYVTPDIIIKKIIQPSIHSRSFLIWSKNVSIDNVARKFIEMFEE